MCLFSFLSALCKYSRVIFHRRRYTSGHIGKINMCVNKIRCIFYMNPSSIWIPFPEISRRMALLLSGRKIKLVVCALFAWVFVEINCTVKMFRFFQKFDVKSKLFQSKTNQTKTPRSNSFRQSCRSIRIISSVFGMSYFHRSSSKASKLASIAYATGIFIVFLASFLYRILNIQPMLCNANAVSYSVLGIQQILSIIAITTIYHQVLFYKSKFAHLLELVTLIEHKCEMLNIQLDYRRFATKILCEILAVVAYISISFAFFVIYYNVWDIGLITLELFVSIIPMLVIILNLMTFINVVWLTRNGVQRIKDFLLQFCAMESLLSDVRSNEVWTVKLMTNQTPYELFNKFKQISQIYGCVCEMANHLNDIFGLSNLASMGKCSLGKLHPIWLNMHVKSR